MTLALAGCAAPRTTALLDQIARRAANDCYFCPSALRISARRWAIKTARLKNLDRAIYDRDPNISGDWKSNPIFESLRNDERYHAILRKMQLAADAI